MIHKLPQSVINQIAAGQVIQRPYNVVKQLIQNSIDADSTQVAVTLLQGGLRQIKIADNGKGIMREDFPLLCARFATSKIKDFTDMRVLSSFGFRGEALASLSYVSRLGVVSKWCKAAIGSGAEFKNEQIEGGISDAVVNQGTVITVNELFYNAESRRQALNPIEERKRIYKLMCHFCLHYPQVKFTLVTDKGDEGLPAARATVGVSQAKMQIFQSITRLSYDKFTYIAPCELTPSAQIQAIITKINCCKGKTLMLNINNRIVENPDLFKTVEKAYAECYQSIHEEIESFWVYVSLVVEPRLIDCNVHPTKKAVGIFAGQDIYDRIRELVLNQIKKDSAIKVLRPSIQLEKNSTLYDSLRQKMGLQAMKTQFSQQSQHPETKIIHASEKNRTDSKQLPLMFYTQPQQQQSQTSNCEDPRNVQKSQTGFSFVPQSNERDPEMKRFFGECTYVGCYGLNYMLIHYENKLYMLSTQPVIPSFVRTQLQNQKLAIRKLSTRISLSNQIRLFIKRTNLLLDAQKVIEWIGQQQNKNKVYELFRIQIQGAQIVSFPCLGDLFVECIDLSQRIGNEIAYLICRVFNSSMKSTLSKKLIDKFMVDFLSAHFLQDRSDLTPFNEQINTYFKNRLIPILKTNPSLHLEHPNLAKYMKQMLDLREVYKIFERC